jgi:transcriptional regulator with PAS, ATPase and Fis domain
MHANYLHTGHSGPMTAEDSGTFQRIADCLAGAGLETVRLGTLEAAAIHVALENSGGNKTHAAKALGISVRTLQCKLRAARPLDVTRP